MDADNEHHQQQQQQQQDYSVHHCPWGNHDTTSKRPRSRSSTLDDDGGGQYGHLTVNEQEHLPQLYQPEQHQQFMESPWRAMKRLRVGEHAWSSTHSNGAQWYQQQEQSHVMNVQHGHAQQYPHHQTPEPPPTTSLRRIISNVPETSQIMSSNSMDSTGSTTISPYTGMNQLLGSLHHQRLMRREVVDLTRVPIQYNSSIPLTELESSERRGRDHPQPWDYDDRGNQGLSGTMNNLNDDHRANQVRPPQIRKIIQLRTDSKLG